MSTIRQLIKNPRSSPWTISKSPALAQCPQKKGTCLRVGIRNPKKPNSASRKVTTVLLSASPRGPRRSASTPQVVVGIPGEGHPLVEHSLVLVRGGRVPDLPGVRYRAISGSLDFAPNKSRKQARSKYGVPSLPAPRGRGVS